MAKTKKRKIKKKILIKKKVKKTRTSRTKKNKEKSTGSGSIFDSTVGKTDALFVDNPKEDIDEIIKEFDSLPENKIENKPIIVDIVPQSDIARSIPQTAPSFWESLIKFLFKKPQ